MESVATRTKHGLRGSDFENRINITIEYYRKKKLALIQKIPTPITPMKFDMESGHITLAYFDKKSTVDYIGVVQEIPVCFDAKETEFENRIPLQNIHEHQVQFMKEFEEQGGIAFLLISFTKTGEIYYLPYKYLEYFKERSKNETKKSIFKDELESQYLIKTKNTLKVDFLQALQIDINNH